MVIYLCRISRLYRFVFVLTVLAILGLVHPVLAAQATENRLIRIHVLAHDDSPEEQAAKLRVRDRILDAIGQLVESAEHSEEAEEIIAANLLEIKKLAEDELQRIELDHKVSIQWGRFVFPSRVYGQTALPAGTYQALNVVIGAGQGKNWWCIMYPPLCYVDGVVKQGHEVSYQSAILNFLRRLWASIGS